MDKEHVINEIKRTAKENNGKPLGSKKFERLTGIKFSDWYGRYWSKWGDAVKEAGLKPNKLQKAYDQQNLINILIAFIREISKFPTIGEIRMKAYNNDDFPSHTAISRGLGKKHEMAQKILYYCESNSGYEDIAKICQSVTSRSKKKVCNVSKENNLKFSFVYLMKSGKYYKIGKSDCVEKRNYEIGIKLPEELKIIHKIKTDDPFGIEAYWHNRFKDKQKQGEWFELTASDIKAFKRRTFM